MNNGIFVQDIYGKTGFENNLPKPLVGVPNSIPMPYHYPGNDWYLGSRNFILVIDTTKESNTIMTLGFSYPPIDVSIDWGDGLFDTFKTSGAISHRYNSHGIYTIQIRGDLSSFWTNNINNRNKIIKCSSFGLTPYLTYGLRDSLNLLEAPDVLNIPMSQIVGLFQGCFSLRRGCKNWNINLITDRSLSQLFYFCSSFNDDLSRWDTSQITDMSTMFHSALAFNQNIGNWDVGKVTNFSNMFYGASNFNNGLSSDINNWNTSSATNMSSMLREAIRFNQPIGSWNVNKVTNFTNMFYITFAFNQDLGNWSINTISNVNMNGMFGNATVFNNAGSSAINNWNTTNVTDMGNMFLNASAFNQPLNNWNVRKVTSFTSMFQGAGSFNSSLSGWALGADTAGTNCSSMFQSATSFNQDISNWDTSKVTNMANMFSNQCPMNYNLGSWNVSNVTNMSNMFYFNYAFGNGGSPDINNWNTGNVTTMRLMFYSTFFNQPIGNWNVSKVTDMRQMFESAFGFNQDISAWNLAGLNANTSLDSFMFNKTGANAYSTTNYNALLIGWNNNKLIGANGVANWRTDLRPHFGGAKYTAGGAAATARAALVSYGWTITDGGTA